MSRAFRLLLLPFAVLAAGELEDILDGVFRQQQKLESAINDVSFLSRYTYEEADGTGRVDRTILAERRVTMKQFERQKHELLSISLNGRPLSRADMEREKISSRAQEEMMRRMKMPFANGLRGDYTYRLIEDSVWNGIDVWRISFEPKKRSAGYVRGSACVSQADTNVVQLNFTPLGVPAIIRDMTAVMDYSCDSGFWLPARFELNAELMIRLIITLVNRRIHIHEEYSGHVFNRELPEGYFDADR